MDAVLLSAACCMCVGHCRRAAAAPAPAQRTASPPHALCLRGGVGGAMPAQMSRIPGVKILSHTPMRLDKTQRWLEATTFDGSDVSSPWMGTWSGDNYTKNELLWTAAEIGDAKAVGRLVAAGADINSANRATQTALHKCAMAGHETVWCLSTLLMFGADPTVVDGGNFTALDYAKEAAEEGGPLPPVELLMAAEHAYAATQHAGSVPGSGGDRQLSAPQTGAVQDGEARLAPSAGGFEDDRAAGEGEGEGEGEGMGAAVGATGEDAALTLVPPSPEEFAAMMQADDASNDELLRRLGSQSAQVIAEFQREQREADGSARGVEEGRTERVVRDGGGTAKPGAANTELAQGRGRKKKRVRYKSVRERWDAFKQKRKAASLGLARPSG